ncbi:apolipoprotein D-like [Sabethes cyaneus]|uniref:apolipoprotein D-like n=1 Tax=Sabethes cyaneus TaxID=53552 RepID=UPI00237D5117|nr:apolipoprotein D-like [Sabethes cyaneus]
MLDLFSRLTVIAVFLLSAAGTTTLVSAQVPFMGRCPNTPVVKDFKAESFLGRWYEQEKYPFVFELAARCVVAEYGLDTEGRISVFNRQLNTITGNENSIRGLARVAQPGKMVVSFSIPFNVDSPYWVIGSDYSNYAVVLSCMDIGGLMHTKVVWILTRDRSPSIDIMKKAYAVLDSAKLSRAYLTRTDQKNCEPRKKKTVPTSKIIIRPIKK